MALPPTYVLFWFIFSLWLLLICGVFGILRLVVFLAFRKGEKTVRKQLHR